MFLLDYSKGHGYSILEECVGCGKLNVLEDDIEDFETALKNLRDYGEDFEMPEQMEEPVVSLSAVKVMLRDLANQILNDLEPVASREPVESLEPVESNEPVESLEPVESVESVEA